MHNALADAVIVLTSCPSPFTKMSPTDDMECPACERRYKNKRITLVAFARLSSPLLL